MSLPPRADQYEGSSTHGGGGGGRRGGHGHCHGIDHSPKVTLVEPEGWDLGGGWAVDRGAWCGVMNGVCGLVVLSGASVRTRTDLSGPPRAATSNPIAPRLACIDSSKLVNCFVSLFLDDNLFSHDL